MVLLVALVYAFIFAYVANDFRKGVKVHKATLAYWQWGVWPRFTVRLSNGRFAANKVSFWHVATH